MLMSFYIQWKYANRTIFKIHTYVTIFCQYFCTFCIMLMIPLDITITIDGRKSSENKQYYDKNYNIIFTMYVALYWIITILSNLVLVVQEQYNSNGFFTIFSRLKNSLWKISLQLFVGILFSVVLFGILIGTNAIQLNFNGIFLTSILITNIIWMVFLMLVLGYGLLMYPIDFWNRGNYQLRLNKLQHEIAKEFENVTQSYSDIFACISTIKQTEREINANPQQYQHLLKPLQILKHDIPIDIDLNTQLGNVIINKQVNEITIGSLANFREKLFWSNCVFTSSQGRLNSLQTKAHFLEDIMESDDAISEIDSKIEGYKHINWSFKEKSTYLEYLWFTSIKPKLYKLIGLIFAFLSICSYCCVISTIKGIPHYMSPYFDIINQKNIQPEVITFFSFITIGYMFFVIKWSLFEMKFFKSLTFVNNRSTWTTPMSINSRIFGSLVYPFIFVYLGWLHENGVNDINDTQTIFSNFYKMKEIPIFGNPANTGFQILLIIVSILTSLNMLNKFLVSIRCSDFQFGITEVSEDLLENGKAKLLKRKKLIKRAYKQSLQKLNDNVETNKKRQGLMDFAVGFSKQSKFHSNGCFIDNDNNDEENINDLNYSSLTITQEQFCEHKKQYSLGDIGKQMESISEIFTKYDTRLPREYEIV